jgi:hypothetical protein
MNFVSDAVPPSVARIVVFGGGFPLIAAAS